MEKVERSERGIRDKKGAASGGREATQIGKIYREEMVYGVSILLLEFSISYEQR